MGMFLVELNILDIYATGIMNSYMYTKTKDKVCIITRNDFGDKEDHIMIIHKVLYALQSS